MYMGSNERSGFNGSETIINPTTAPNLKLHWKYKAGGVISTQPVTFNGHIYYAFDRTKISAEPLWEKPVSSARNNISPSAWDGTTLYVASTLNAFGP